MNGLASTASTLEPETQMRPISNVRRKPRLTYKSPSGDASFILGPISLSASQQQSAPSSSTLQPITFTVSTNAMNASTTSTPLKRKKYPMAPPLPLYHPLGRLASSLPPLDPTSVGLPTPVRSDGSIRSSARARRPAAKLRDVTVEDELQPTVPPAATTSPILDVEIKEKPSPRKRRAGGGSKRKRREVDDGDATYPAKRTRMPRGASNQFAADEEAPLESIMSEVTPTPEPMSEVPEDKQPERRSTRSRGSARRRDSSASEAASSNSTGVVVPQDREESIPMEVDKAFDPVAPQSSGPVKIDEKEEGELSDDGLLAIPS
ncbi:hypothetical protein DXG01_004821 [Tephrocybe rancida]|nr:hypothetical protein DXG01_004821 [Tephrocybe rancida]